MPPPRHPGAAGEFPHLPSRAVAALGDVARALALRPDPPAPLPRPDFRHIVPVASRRQSPGPDGSSAPDPIATACAAAVAVAALAEVDPLGMAELEHEIRQGRAAPAHADVTAPARPV